MAIDLSTLFGQQQDYSQLISPAEQQRLQSNAGQQALLNSAIALLAQSGRTREPISTGQIFGSALGAGMEGYNQSFDRTLKQMVTGMQLGDYKKKQDAQKRLQEAIQGATKEIPQFGIVPTETGEMPTAETLSALTMPIAPKRTLDLAKLQEALITEGAIQNPLELLKVLGKEPKESFRPLSTEEKRQFGLPQDQSFQISSSGKIDQVSKGELVKIEKGDSELEKLDAQQIAAMSAKATSANEFARTASAIDTLLKGKGGGAVVKVGSDIATALNLPSDTASANALATAFQTRAATQVRAAGSGSTSDLEFKAYLSVFPSLANTEQGRTLMAKGLQAFAERDALIEKKARELFRAKNYSAQAIVEYDRSLGSVLGEEFKPYLGQQAKPQRRSF